MRTHTSEWVKRSKKNTRVQIRRIVQSIIAEILLLDWEREREGERQRACRRRNRRPLQMSAHKKCDEIFKVKSITPDSLCIRNSIAGNTKLNIQLQLNCASVNAVGGGRGAPFCIVCLVAAGHFGRTCVGFVNCEYYHYEVAAVVMVSTAVKAFAGYGSGGCLVAKVFRFL